MYGAADGKNLTFLVKNFKPELRGTQKIKKKNAKTPHRWYQCSYDLIEIYAGKRRNKSLCVWKKN